MNVIRYKLMLRWVINPKAIKADIRHFNKNAVVDKTSVKKIVKNAKKFSKAENKVLKEGKIKMDEFNKNKFNKTNPKFD